MKKAKLLLLLFLFLLVFFYGYKVGKHEYFPYQFIKMVKNKIIPPKKFPRNNIYTRDSHKLFQKYNYKADVVFIGDSRVLQGRWHEFFPNIKVANRGVGGDISSDIIYRLSSVLSTQPSKAFIMVGINDISQNIPVSEIIYNYSLIVDALVEADIEVFIQPTIQCQIPICSENLVDTINELNNGLAELAIEKDVNFINLGDLSDQDGLNQKYSIDGIHLSAEGYFYWVDKLHPYVSE